MSIDNECERRRKGLDLGEEIKAWRNKGIHGRTHFGVPKQKNLR